MRPLNWIQWVTLLTVVALAVTTVLLTLEIRTTQRQSSEAIRNVLCYFEDRALSSPALTAKQKRQATVIYRNALAKIDEPDCRTNS